VDVLAYSLPVRRSFFPLWVGRLLDREELKIPEVYNWKQELRPATKASFRLCLSSPGCPFQMDFPPIVVFLHGRHITGNAFSV
jgi:hypothetical protein